MLEEKQKKESESIIKQLINEGKIINPNQKVESFFLDKSSTALQVSKKLFEISEDKNNHFDGYTWIINIAYYSMFYAATALLAHFNHRIKSEVGVHKLTYHALVYYFLIDDNKLQNHFIEQYKESYEDAEQLLQISEEKAVEMIEYLNFEHTKRIKFTYDVGEVAERNKAKTSLKRAEDFLTEVKKMIIYKMIK